MAEAHPELADLTTRPNELDAGLVRAVLSEAGIEAWLHTAPGALLGAFGTLTFVPTIVRVRESDLERAQQVLDRNRQDSVDLDWDEVDVGEPADDLAAAIAATDRGVPLGSLPKRSRLLAGAGMWILVTGAGVLALGWVFLAVTATLAAVWLFRERVLADKRARRAVWGRE